MCTVHVEWFESHRDKFQCIFMSLANKYSCMFVCCRQMCWRSTRTLHLHWLARVETLVHCPHIQLQTVMDCLVCAKSQVSYTPFSLRYLYYLVNRPRQVARLSTALNFIAVTGGSTLVFLSTPCRVWAVRLLGIAMQQLFSASRTCRFLFLLLLASMDSYFFYSVVRCIRSGFSLTSVW